MEINFYLYWYHFVAIYCIGYCLTARLLYRKFKTWPGWEAGPVSLFLSFVWPLTLPLFGFVYRD